VWLQLALLEQGELFAQEEVFGSHCAARPGTEHEETDESSGDEGHTVPSSHKSGLRREIVEQFKRHARHFPVSQSVLTTGQRETRQLVAEGRTAKETAGILNVALQTVAFHKLTGTYGRVEPSLRFNEASLRPSPGSWKRIHSWINSMACVK
jgi:DNA-binding CsgD family transcriptional regulator